MSSQATHMRLLPTLRLFDKSCECQWYILGVRILAYICYYCSFHFRAILKVTKKSKAEAEPGGDGGQWTTVAPEFSFIIFLQK